MALFSQRQGLKPVKTIFQINSIDDELKNSLWNAFYLFMWVPHTLPDVTGTRMISNYYQLLTQKIFLGYLKRPLDGQSLESKSALNYLKTYFFNCEWYELYDFLEFSAQAYPDNEHGQRFRDYCNSILEKEMSAYRFVGEHIIQMTNDTEINEIEEALASTTSIDAIQTHLKQAVGLLSDRSAPDYRNSIKESISAVEAICKLITGNTNTTLGAALNEIEKNQLIPLHHNLKEAFKQLYWYTSDAAGIRHAIKDNSSVDFEDAKFMLVSSVAFINYLLAQSAKSGLKI